MLKQYEELKTKKDGLVSTLDTLKEHDPETIRQMSPFRTACRVLEQDIKTAVQGANRWTGCWYGVES